MPVAAWMMDEAWAVASNAGSAAIGATPTSAKHVFTTAAVALPTLFPSDATRKRLLAWATKTDSANPLAHTASRKI